MIKRLRSSLKGGELGPTLLRALAGSAGIRIIGMGFGFLVGVQLARGLGAEGFGVYGLAMSIISLATIPTEFGLPQLVTREVAAAQVRNDGPLIQRVLHWANRTVVWLSLSVVGAGLIGWLLFKELFSPGVAIALFAGLPLVPLVALGNLRGAALRGLQQIVSGQVPEVVLRPAIFSLLILLGTIFLPSGLSPAIAVVMQVVAAAVALIVAILLLRSVLPKRPLIPNPETHAKAWLRSAMPMALTEGMRVLHGNVSILMLGALSTTALVGVFRVASSMGLLLSMPVSLLHVVSAPIFSRLHSAQDHRRLQQMLRWVAAAMLLGVAMVALPFFVMGPDLLEMVFGYEFAASNEPLLIISAGTLIGSTFGAGATLLNMTGHEGRVTRASGLCLAALGLLSLPLIQFWGVVGAAWANSITFLMWNVLMWLDAKQLLGLDTSVFNFFSKGSSDA